MLTKNRIGLLITLSALAAFVAVGSSSLALGTSPSGARENAEKWLDQQGKHIGFDSNSMSLFVIASSSIAQTPSNSAYFASRAAAFDSAMQSARQSAAEFLAAEISTSIATKADMHKSYDEVLVDPKLADVLSRTATSKFATSKQIKDMVNVVARSAMVGLSPWNTFESMDENGNGEVAIVAALSRRYSDAVQGKRLANEKGVSLDAWFKGISDADLASTLGTRFKADETGTLQTVAFGQARIFPEPGMEVHATDAADIIATRDLGFVRGEQVASKTFRESLTAQLESSDLPKSFRSTEDYEKVVTSHSNLKGVSLRRVGWRTVVDPVSGDRVAVVMCSMEAVQSARPASASSAASTKQVVADDCPPVPANMASAVRPVRVHGTGATRSAATAAALMEGVRQEGTTVKGNSRLEKRFAEAMESVAGEIEKKVAASTNQESTVETFSNGFIWSYAKVSESQDGGIFDVELCVNLVRFDPKNPRFGLPPTVAVLPFSCGAEAAIAQGRLTTTTEKAIEKALVQLKQFQVIDAKNELKLQSIRDNAARLVLTGHAQEVEALKLGNELTADFVVIGSLIELKFTGQPGPLPQAIQANEIAQATVEGKLINVASGEVIWVDTETIIMKGRDLLLVRAGRGLQDPNEPNMSPVELVCTRAARALGKSLLAKVAPDGIPAIPDPVNASTAVIRVVGKVLSIDASFPGVKVGAQFAIENPVEVSLPGGRKVLDHDRFGKIIISSIANGLAKATLVEGDSDLIHVGVSEIVLLKE
jgi:hypothetical protein